MRYNSLIGSGLDRWNQKPTPSQLQVWKDLENPNILFSGAYRAGKSEIMCRCALRHALTHPGAKVGLFRNYLKSLKQSTLITLLSLIDPDWLTDWSNIEFVATLWNGSRISFFGCDDADRIGSVELSFAGIDEAHEITEEALTMIRGRLSLKVAPNSEYKHLESPRQLLLAVNPKSKSHHLYKRFFSDRDGHKVYYGNSFENHYLPPDYLENLIHVYRRPSSSIEQIQKLISKLAQDRESALLELASHFNSHGRRNLLGLWGSSDLQIYPDLESAIADRPSSFDLTIVGIDWGFENPRWLKLGEYRGKWYVIDYWSPVKITPSEFIDGIVDRSDGVAFHYLPHDQPGLTKELKRRIRTVRKAKTHVFSGISKVASDLGKTLWICPQKSSDYDVFLSELTGYEWQVDRQGEVLDKPLKQADHYCLLPGTLVTTLSGDKPIESLKLGELVYTREGWFPVELVALTDEKPIYKIKTKNTVLFASGDHPVYNEDKGEFVPAANLKVGDTLCFLKKQSSIEGLSSDDTQTLKDTLIGSISDVQNLKVGIQSIFTDKSIATSTGKFLMGIISITKTVMRAITTPITWKQLILKPISLCTQEKGIWTLYLKQEKLLKSGTDQKMVEIGTENTLKKLFRKIGRNLKKSLPAYSVENSVLETHGEIEENTAIKTAKLLTSERVEEVKLVSISRCIEIGVEVAHEYFANGLLVGNCDALRYAYYSHAVRTRYGESEED